MSKLTLTASKRGVKIQVRFNTSNPNELDDYSVKPNRMVSLVHSLMSGSLDERGILFDNEGRTGSCMGVAKVLLANGYHVEGIPEKSRPERASTNGLVC